MFIFFISLKYIKKVKKMKLISLNQPKTKKISNFDSSFAHRNKIINKKHEELYGPTKKEVDKAIILVIMIFTLFIIAGYLL